MSLSSPRVSVVIPTYQRAGVIKQTLDTVFNQTFQDFEVLVADDGSTDNTPEIVAQYGQRLQYLRQENRGPSAARNAAIAASTGELIAFQDDDDLWEPDKLARQVAIFDSKPDVGLVYSDMRYFGAGGERKATAFRHIAPVAGWVLKPLFVYGSPLNTPTVMVRRTTLDQVGRFDESLRMFEDHDLWFRLARVCQVDYVDAVLVHCRRDERRVYDFRQVHRTLAKVKRRMLDASPQLAQECSQAEMFLGYCQHEYFAAKFDLLEGNPQSSRQRLSACLKYCPWWPKAWLMRLASYYPAPFLAAYRRLRPGSTHALGSS